MKPTKFEAEGGTVTWKETSNAHVTSRLLPPEIDVVPALAKSCIYPSISAKNTNYLNLHLLARHSLNQWTPTFNNFSHSPNNFGTVQPSTDLQFIYRTREQSKISISHQSSLALIPKATTPKATPIQRLMISQTKPERPKNKNSKMPAHVRSPSSFGPARPHVHSAKPDAAVE